jgi:hypothetical protein
VRNAIKILLLFVLLIKGFNGNCQKDNSATKKDTAHYIQMTGIVITDSLMRVPFTKVIDISRNRGVIADYYGYFALVVRPGDTIQFSSIGYKTKLYYISDTSTIESFSLIQVLKEDTIMSEPVDVYPWPSREAFADAFVNMESPNDALKRARQRLTPQEMAFVGAVMNSDGVSSYGAYQKQFMDDQYTRGQLPANNLLNPAAWSELFKGLGTGKYRISN